MVRRPPRLLADVRSHRLFDRGRIRVEFENPPADAELVEQFGERAGNVSTSDLAVELCWTEGYGAASLAVEK